MQRLSRWLIGSIGLLATAFAYGGDAWPQFRGPSQQGMSDAAPGSVPTTWSEQEHVKWKTPIAGLGWSSPVILDKQIWITTALDDGHSLHAICLDQDTGKIVYDIELFSEATLEHKNDLNSYASPTAVLEKGRAYFSFGTYGNACVDTTNGKILWKNNELKLDHLEGPGSSPILYGDWFVLHCDGVDLQCVAFIDKQSGKLVQKLPRTFPMNTIRPDQHKAFSVPFIISYSGHDEMMTLGSHRVSGYSLPGRVESWHLDIPGYSNVPRPVYVDGVAYISTGYDNAELWAIRPPLPGSVGDVSVLWKWKLGAPEKPSIVVVDGTVYFCSDKGVARALDAKTGEQLFQNRILGSVSSSPIYAGGLIYFSDERGKTVVLRPGKTLDKVAENQLPGRILASPAVVGNAIYLRTDAALYRLEN